MTEKCFSCGKIMKDNEKCYVYVGDNYNDYYCIKCYDEEDPDFKSVGSWLEDIA